MKTHLCVSIEGSVLQKLKEHIKNYGGSQSAFVENAIIQAVEVGNNPTPQASLDMTRIAEDYVYATTQHRWGGPTDNRKGPYWPTVHTAPIPEDHRKFILRNKDSFTEAWFKAINPSRERISKVVPWYGARSLAGYDRWLMTWCLDEILLQVPADDHDEAYNEPFREDFARAKSHLKRR